MVCKRPFSWRKKWENNWNEVKYCSQKCRRNKNTALVWFRNDLCVADNQSLYDAATKHDKVIGFVLIPAEWLAETPIGFKKMEAFRARFLLESIADLQRDLESHHIPLIVKIDDGTSLTQICSQYQITDIYLQKEGQKRRLTKKKVSQNRLRFTSPTTNFYFTPMTCQSQSRSYQKFLPSFVKYAKRKSTSVLVC